MFGKFSSNCMISINIQVPDSEYGKIPLSPFVVKTVLFVREIEVFKAILLFHLKKLLPLASV